MSLISPQTLPLAVSVDEAAQLLGIGRTKLYAVIAEGKITARKQGRRTLIEVSELHRYLQALPEFGLN